MLKLLYFFPFDPLPGNSGAAQRCTQLLTALRDLNVSVHLAFLSKRAPSDARAECDEIRDAFGAEASSYAASSIDYRLGAVARRGLLAIGQSPALVFPPYTSPLLAAWLGRLVHRTAPDALLMSYAFTDPILWRMTGRKLPKIIDAIDLYSSHVSQLERVDEYITSGSLDVSNLDSALLRDDFYDGSSRCDPREFGIYDRYEETIAISGTEGALIRRVTSKTNVTHIPLTHEVVALENRYDGAALFAMRDNPFNLHAYAYFVREVLPLVLEACPDFVLRVVGTGCKRVTGARGVQLVGYVDDLKAEYAAARFFVNPMLGGTGQQVKLVEAMAHGLASVAFARAAAESPIVHGHTGFAASDKHTFAEHVVELWMNASRRGEMGNNARNHVALHFGKERLMEGLNQVMQRLRQLV